MERLAEQGYQFCCIDPEGDYAALPAAVILATLFTELMAMRATNGRPHWIMVDEAQHLWPSEWEAGRWLVPDAVHGMVFVTLHPDHLAGAVIKHINVLIAIGESPAERYEEFERATG